jgi:hypothetical protein
MSEEEVDAGADEVMKMIALCRSFHVLPRPGGLLDQDSFFVHMASAAEQALAERTQRETQRR